MNEHILGIPVTGLAELSRKVASEGAVLLKNDEKVLPIKEEDNVAVFGRIQIDYYRSGTGSGGAVNVSYTTNLLEGLRNSGRVQVNEELAEIYEKWIKENPFDNGGGGWACEPWCQKEMPVSEELAKKAAGLSNKAIVVIGRTAGEDKDNVNAEGGYCLTQAEKEMILKVNAHFENVILVLNVANVIDMSFFESKEANHIKAILYAWQGGMEGGNAVADVLSGKVNPSGKLTDSIAKEITDYPSDKNHGGELQNIYEEDIYIGYRFFETFRKESVLYPFGFGLSYTDFSIKYIGSEITEERNIKITVEVKNTGSAYAGKEVIQVYAEGPQGVLGRPARELVGFQKTQLLECGQMQQVEINIPIENLAIYDDGGFTGNKSCYVLEAGEYRFHVGNSVRNTQPVSIGSKGLIIKETEVIRRCNEAMAPDEDFNRLKPGNRKPDGSYEETYEQVPIKTVSLEKRIAEELPKEYSITGNKGIKLQDVRTGKATMENFVAQLSKEELAMIVRGEGMCSTKVTPGTAAAFGGVSDSLLNYGIPIACCADGPSGVRMDSGLKATQLPIGTLLACTWDTAFVEELFTLQGKEIEQNEVDCLLGPGINIHRHPLNGRNFEYFSEDPLITGKMTAAIVRGIGKNQAVATVKHFAVNSQETNRHNIDALVSERALREIYLKGFELAVKEGNAKAIMTSYNPINGHWAASNYDLNTTILRKEWGYTGFVMTDWWAKMNDVVTGGESSNKDTRDMVRAQNDVYMVVTNNGAELNAMGDNTLEALAEGRLTIGELQRNAMNLCRFLMNTQAMDRKGIGEISVAKFLAEKNPNEKETITQFMDTGARLDTTKGNHIWFEVTRPGIYSVVVKIMSPQSNIAQTVCKASLNGTLMNTFQTNGTDGRWIMQKLLKVELEKGYYHLFLNFTKPGMQVEYMEFELV